MSWNHLERAGTTSSEVEVPEARWIHLKQDGLSNELTQKHKKFIGETASVMPLRNKISNSFCHKEHHFRC